MYYYYVCTNLSKNDKEYFVTFYRDGFHEYMIKTNILFTSYVNWRKKNIVINTVTKIIRLLCENDIEVEKCTYISKTG